MGWVAAEQALPPHDKPHQGRRDPPLLSFVVGNGVAVFVGLIAAYIALTRTGDVPLQLISIKTSDFSQYYNSARLLLEGHGASMYDFHVLGDREYALSRPLGTPHGVLPYLYPPYFILLIAPLAMLPYTAAFLGWLLVNCCLLSLVMFWFQQFSGLSGRSALVFRGLALCCFPLFLSLGLGQVSVFLLAAFALGFFALLSGREVLGGAALACAALKPQYVLPVLMVIVLHRRWRAVLSCAATLVGLAALPVPFFGLSVNSAYLNVVRTVTGWQGRSGKVEFHGVSVAPATYAPVWNHGLAGFWQLIARPPETMLLTFACSAFLLAALAGFAWRASALDLALGMAVPVGLLISPHTLGYDLTLLLLPAAVLLRHRAGRTAPILLTAGWLALMAGYPLAFLARFQLSTVLMCALSMSFFLVARGPLGHHTPTAAAPAFMHPDRLGAPPH